MQTITTPRLVLRKFAETDAEDIFLWAGDPRVTAFTSLPTQESLASTKELLAGWLADDENFHWAVEFNGRVIGHAYSHYVSWHHNHCELGYVIGYDHWGKGLASEALRGILAYLFNQTTMHRVEALYETDNPASGKVMQKCGLRYEGTKRQFFRCRNGSYADALTYVILRDEFHAETFVVAPITAAHRAFVDAQIAESWAGPFVASRGVLHDTRRQPGFVAVAGEDVLGYVLYDFAGGGCEITVLQSLRENRGIGRALIQAVIEQAKTARCERVWLITTNDNTHAIRFYQRIGFSLRAVHINAMDEARKLKPQIPLLGDDDIPIAHEFEFEKEISPCSTSA